MMEVTALSQPQTPRPEQRPGEQRSEALAEKRRALSDEQLAQAAASKAHAADRLAEVREAVARVVGANTRLSISRSETNFNFVYRAIDVETGEVVNEWPQEKFVQLVRGVRDDVRTDIEAGMMLDRVA